MKINTGSIERKKNNHVITNNQTNKRESTLTRIEEPVYSSVNVRTGASARKSNMKKKNARLSTWRVVNRRVLLVNRGELLAGFINRGE